MLPASMASPTKKMLNSVETCVDDNLAGLVACNPGLRRLDGCPRVVIRADIEEYMAAGKVTILSGGGSGHEPFGAGFVGGGMLSAAVMGDVFASPGPGPIMAALRALGANHPAGVLVMFNNYTGDRINFGIAVERARAEGIKVEVVAVGDDCAHCNHDKSAGRRGLAGSTLIVKIACALAEQGASLEEVTNTAREAAKGLGTLGLCLKPCSLPGTPPLFHIEDDQMELGLGLHGEAGIKTVKMMPAKDTVAMMLSYMLDEDRATRVPVTTGDQIAVLVNNLGSTSNLELNIVVKETVEQLEERGLFVVRMYAGRYSTSQEMAGFSISLLKLNDTYKHCLDYDTSVSNWMKPLMPPGERDRQTPPPLKLPGSSQQWMTDRSDNIAASVDTEMSTVIKASLRSACQSLVASEDRLNALDSGSGDGDCGATIASGARAILHRLDESSLSVEQPGRLLLELAELVGDVMGGCSGGLYSLCFTAAAPCLKYDVSPQTCVEAMKAGLCTIMKYGNAEPGDRTMVDPLHAALQVLITTDSPGLDHLKRAAEAADVAAQNTAQMTARAGRASYVNKERLTEPDPGAVAVSVWFTAIYDTLKQYYTEK